MAEKRDTRRIRRRLSIKYGLEKPERMGFTEDISAQGLFLKGNFVFAPRTIILIEIQLPDGSQVVLQGRVRWAKKVPPNLMRLTKAGMGIRIQRFLSGEEDYRRFLADLNSH